MERVRKPWQGVTNIVRFNWHFYLAALVLLVSLLLIAYKTAENVASIASVLTWIISLTILITLLVSFYIYDLSGLYKLRWLNTALGQRDSHLLNIHAGFDETSMLLYQKYPGVNLHVCDFYDEQKHTELSIKRARKAYPSFPGTIPVRTRRLPFQDLSMDSILIFFAAHEIRNNEERILFFRELGRICSNMGKIVVVEHQRDMANFLAYNIGFFHFLSQATWKTTFANAALTVESKKKITPFITCYTLRKNGASYPDHR